MKLPAFFVLALGVVLAGCTDDKLGPQCPSASVLSDTAVMTVFRAGAPADPSGEAYTATMGVVQTECSYPKGSSSVTSSLGFTVRATRAPSPDAASYVLPYYMAITQGDRILSKRSLTLRINFAPGSASTSVEESLPEDIRINLEPTHPPTDYQLLLGFQLTDAQRAYNQTRARYTP